MSGINPDENRLIQITILAPESVALIVQEAAHHALLDALAEDEIIGDGLGGEFSPLSHSAAVAKFRDVWNLPDWGAAEDDRQRARWVYDDLGVGSRLQALVKSFVVNAGGVDGAQLANDAGYESPSAVPPALKHLAARCRRVQRRPLWQFERLDGVGRYSMTPAAVDLFKSAIAHKAA